MDKKNPHESRSDSTQGKLSDRKNHIIRGNSKKQHKRLGSVERIRERWQTSIGRQWSSIYREKNIYHKQPEDIRANLTR